MNTTTVLPALITSTAEARKNYLLSGSCIHKARYEHDYAQLYRLAFDYDRLVVTCPDALQALYRLTTDDEFPHFLRQWIYSGLPVFCRTVQQDALPHCAALQVIDIMMPQFIHQKEQK